MSTYRAKPDRKKGVLKLVSVGFRRDVGCGPPERHDLVILLARVFAEQVGDPVPAALTRATTFALPRA